MTKKVYEDTVDDLVSRWNLPLDFEPISSKSLVSSYHILGVKTQDNLDPVLWNNKPTSDFIDQLDHLPDQKRWNGLLSKHGIIYDSERHHFVKINSLEDVRYNKILSTSFISFKKTWASVLNDDSSWNSFLAFKKFIDAPQLNPWLEPSPYLPVCYGYICFECGTAFARQFTDTDKSCSLLLTQHYEKVHTDLKVENRIYVSGLVQPATSNSFHAVKLGKKQLLHLQHYDEKVCLIYKELICAGFMSEYHKGVTTEKYPLILNSLIKLILGLSDYLSVTRMLLPVIEQCIKCVENKEDDSYTLLQELIFKAQYEYRCQRENISDEIFKLTFLDLQDSLGYYLGYLLQCYGLKKDIRIEYRPKFSVDNDSLSCSFGPFLNVTDFNIWYILMIRIICYNTINIFPSHWPSWKSREFRVLHSIKTLLTQNLIEKQKKKLSIDSLKSITESYHLKYNKKPHIDTNNNEKNTKFSNDKINDNNDNSLKPICTDTNEQLKFLGEEPSRLKQLILEMNEITTNSDIEWTEKNINVVYEIIEKIIIESTIIAVGTDVIQDIEPIGLDSGHHYELDQFDCSVDHIGAQFSSHFLYLLLMLQGQKFKNEQAKSVDTYSNWNFSFDNGIKTSGKDLSIASTVILVGWGLKDCKLTPNEAQLVGYITCFRAHNS